MKIALSVDSYSGVDGSSLSSTRCSQIVQVYEMLEEFGKKKITYRQLQEEADKRELFGDTGAKSAIRTFFPLLKKIKFVEYPAEKTETFPANECFTKLGTQFVLASRAMDSVTEDTPSKEEVLARLQNIKSNAQKQGLINMFNNPDCKEHNMWVALRLLKEFKSIHWNEFLYTLHCFELDESMEDAIEKISKNRKKIATYTFTKEDGKKLPNTCYSYLRSYLEEAGLISNISSFESKLLEDADKFYSYISL